MVERHTIDDARAELGDDQGDPTDDQRELAVPNEVEEQLRRTLADLDNLRKRFNREIARERAAERAHVAALWLPIVDDLERALQHADGDDSPLVEGVRAVYEHALGVLARLGFPRFDDIGERFDPSRHEAVGTIESSAPAGAIVAAARPGYGMADNVLRPASVVVARGPS
jgi:molecular chaperone GrpE